MASASAAPWKVDTSAETYAMVWPGLRRTVWISAVTYLDFLGRRLELRLGTATDDHIGAVRREALGQRKAKSLRAASNQDILHQTYHIPCLWQSTTWTAAETSPSRAQRTVPESPTWKTEPPLGRHANVGVCQRHRTCAGLQRGYSAAESGSTCFLLPWMAPSPRFQLAIRRDAAGACARGKRLPVHWHATPKGPKCNRRRSAAGRILTGAT